MAASNRNVSVVTGMQRLESMARQFRRQKPPLIVDDSKKRAAVLVCLFEGENGDLRVILTKRASTLSSFPGEVSLPGGKVEEGDGSYVETALREAKEEIGLNSRDVTIVSTLDSFVSKTDVYVVPVIGYLSGGEKAFVPSLNSAEVELVFHAPFEMFLKGENMRSEEWDLRGEKFICSLFDFEENGNKHVIFALTAVILISSASLIYQRPPDFPELRLKNWNIDPLKHSSAL